MWRAFNLKGIRFEGGGQSNTWDINHDDAIAKINHNSNEPLVASENAYRLVQDAILSNGDVSGDKLKGEVFPTDARWDVFISHSGDDKGTVQTLADWLRSQFGITSFVDWQLWGDFGKLLSALDEHFKNELKGQYTVKLQNRVVSAAHLMLNVSLMEAMDKCEALFFVNTPNSIAPGDITNETYSPWIFSEIGMYNMIRKRVPESPLSMESAEMKHLIESQVRLPLDLSKFTVLDNGALCKWRDKYHRTLNNYGSQGILASGSFALAKLYELHPMDMKLLKG